LLIISRKQRKQAAQYDALQRMRRILLFMLAALSLWSSWYWGGALLFTISFALLSCSVLIVNPQQIRRYIPGIRSPNRLTRGLVQLVYVLLVLAIIAFAGNFTTLN
jgi:hypothetical protein